MRFYTTIIYLLLANSAFCQRNRFHIFPDLGYSYQKVHNFNAGLHLGVMRPDSTSYMNAAYSFAMNAEFIKFNNTTYLSPSFGVRGYNYLFGRHHGICYGINVSNYHAYGSPDWLLTPEFGFAYGGCIQLMLGYSINLDQPDLDFYNHSKLSVRLAL